MSRDHRRIAAVWLLAMGYDSGDVSRHWVHSGLGSSALPMGVKRADDDVPATCLRECNANSPAFAWRASVGASAGHNPGAVVDPDVEGHTLTPLEGGSRAEDPSPPVGGPPPHNLGND